MACTWPTDSLRIAATSGCRAAFCCSSPATPCRLFLMRWCTSLTSISRCAMAASKRACASARCSVTSLATSSTCSRAPALVGSETKRVSHSRAPAAPSSRNSRRSTSLAAPALRRSAAIASPGAPKNQSCGVPPTSCSAGRSKKAAAIWLTCSTRNECASNRAMASGAVSMMRCSEACAWAMLTSAWRRRSMSSSAKVTCAPLEPRPLSTALPTTQNSRPSRALSRHSKVCAWPSASVCG